MDDNASTPSGKPEPPSAETPSRNEEMAQASLVLGLFSVVCCGAIAGLPAIILGHRARNRARCTMDQSGVARKATYGMILGYIGLVLTLLITSLFVVLLPALKSAKGKSPRLECVNNLKIVGLSLEQWRSAHSNEYPFNLSGEAGGTLELCDRSASGFDRNASLHFQVLSNELSNPKWLICYMDKTRSPAKDFASLSSNNVSYLLRTGTNVSPANPEEILACCPFHNLVLRCDLSVGRGPKQ